MPFRSFMTQSVAQRREMILYGSSLKSLLYLSFPTLLMGLVQSLIPLTDGLFLNRTSSVAVAGAVGFAIPIINALISLSQGISVAAMTVIGQLFGKGDMKKVRHCASQTMFYCFLLGVIMAPLTAIIGLYFSYHVSPEIAAPLLRYLALYSFVLPFLFIAGIFNSIKSATGQPEANFLRMLMLFIMKIVFNYIFLYRLQLNEIGAVTASFCSYLGISIWMVYDLYFINSETKLSITDIKPDKEFLLTLFKLSIPSMISNVMINIGFILINMEVERFGKIVLNSQTIASNINAMMFTVPSSISSTITAMVSMNIGIKNGKKAKQVFLIGTVVSLVLSFIMIAVFLPLAPTLVKLFREEPDIVEIATHSLRIYTWSIIGFGVFMAAMGAFIGLGRMKMPLVAGVLRIWLIRYIFIKIFVDMMGVDAVFWGNLVSNYICAIIFFVILLLIPWKSAIEDQLNKAT